MNRDESLRADLVARLGDGAREALARLPGAEIRYLASRPELVGRYANGGRGRFLLTWEMSAVERGDEACAEIERAAPVAWQGARVLDVGCNDGGFLVAFARRGAVAHGVDLGGHGLLSARRRAREWGVPAYPTAASALQLPYRSASFAAVTCGDVIEHLRAREQALREIARVLVPGGVLWLSAPTRFKLSHLRADPHFGCFGVAPLPRVAAAWIVARVARRLPSPDDYDVQTLPTFRALERALRAAGFTVLAGGPMHRRDPETVRTPWKRRAVRRAQRLLPNGLLSVIGWSCAELLQPFRVVCRKLP
jgi:SAM-dependent methyltransferase